MAALEWVMKLQDLVSGPMAGIERQLKSTTLAIKALDIATHQTKLEKLTDPIKRQRLELTLHRDQLRLAKMAIDDHSSASTRAAGATSGWLNRLHDSVHIVSMLAQGFRWAAREASEMGRKIEQAVTFKESALLGLQTSLGAKGGSQMFGDVMGMAVRFGGNPQAMVGQAQDFARFGAPPQLATLLTKGMLDVKALGGVHGQRDADEATSAIMDSLSEGKITERTMRRFRGILPRRPMMESLRVAQGLPSIAAAEQLLRSPNGAPGDRIMGMALEGIQALEKGPIGTAALKASKNWEGLMERLQARWTKLWSSVADTKGFRTIERAVDGLIKVLGEQKTQDLIQKLADNFGKIFEPLTGPEGKKRMEQFFQRLTELAQGTLPVITALGNGIESLMKRFAPTDDDKRNAMNAALSENPRQVFSMSGRPVTPEEFFGLPPRRYGSGDVQIADRGMQGRDPREDQHAGGRRTMQLQPITLHATSNVHIHGNVNATSPHEIAEHAKDAQVTAIADSLEQFANETGAQ